MRNNNTGFTRHLSESGFVQIISIIVIVVVGIVVGFYVKSLKNKPALIDSVTNNIVAPTQNPNTQKDILSDWEEYTNKQLGISLKHKKFNQNYSLIELENGFSLSCSECDATPFKVINYPNTTINTVSVKDFNECRAEDVKEAFPTLTKTTINEFEATEMKVLCRHVSFYQFLYLQQGGNVLSIQTEQCLDKNSSYLSNGCEHEKILSTVKFMPQDLFTPIPCAGFAGVKCPEGYTCKIIDTYPDAAGSCVK